MEGIKKNSHFRLRMTRYMHHCLNTVIIWFSGLQSVWRSCKEGYIHVSIATFSLQCWYSPDSTTLVGTRTDWVFRSHKVRRTFPISYFFCHIRQYLWIKKFRIHVYKVLNLDFEQPARILTTSACYFLSICTFTFSFFFNLFMTVYWYFHEGVLLLINVVNIR